MANRNRSKFAVYIELERALRTLASSSGGAACPGTLLPNAFKPDIYDKTFIVMDLNNDPFINVLGTPKDA